jgi:predicted RNase H-like nuclease (RuvC/YqgF family)
MVEAIGAYPSAVLESGSTRWQEGEMPTGESPRMEGLAAGALTERESELLRQASERIHVLSQRAAEAERESERYRMALQQAEAVLAETRRTRDVLSAQVESLMREADREYEERAELRRLLASAQMQLQSLLASMMAVPSSNGGPLLGRFAPQRGRLAPPRRHELAGLR